MAVLQRVKAATTTQTTTLTATLPGAATVGSTQIALITTTSGSSGITMPGGWTQRATNTLQLANNFVYERTTTTTSQTSLALTFPSGGAVIYLIEVSGLTAFDVAGTATSGAGPSASYSAGTLTPTTTNTYLIAFTAHTTSTTDTFSAPVTLVDQHQLAGATSTLFHNAYAEGSITATTAQSVTVTPAASASGWEGLLLAWKASAGTGSGTVNLTGSGTLAIAGQADGSGSVALSGSGTLAVAGSGTAPPPPAATAPVPRAEWSAFARDASLGLTEALPIIDAQFVIKHMGLDKAILTTPYTAARWLAVQPSYGIALYRSGVLKFSGPITSRQLTWSDDGAVIRVEAVGDEIVLADRLTFPDPLRAADDQTVNDYWTSTGKASAAMRQLISDQAGPTCRTDRRVTGLTLGVDPDVGTSRTWQGLFESVLDLLATMATASGANLGVRVAPSAGSLVASVVAPRNLVGTVTFSADLSNLGGIVFAESAPETTTALVAGQGDLHLRTRKVATTTDPGATRWGRQVWKYVDRRDSADATALTNAATDALADGPAGVSLSLTLLDSQAATYGIDWDLGDKVTVYVGLPDESKVAQVDDVVREITFSIDSDGVERIQPAIGSVDARTFLPTPSQRVLADVVRQSTSLARQK